MLAETEPLTAELEQAAGLIRDRINRTAYDIGVELQEAKALCKHGQWAAFLTAAGVGERTAQRMMQYARLIAADWDIDTEKPLPPVSAVLGKSANLTVLINDEVDTKLVEEAEQRESGWQRQADNPPEPEPRQRTPAPEEPEVLEGDIISPSSPEDQLASMQVYVDELEAKLEAAEERIAIWIDGANEPKKIADIEGQIRVLASQLHNRDEEIRRLNYTIKAIKRGEKS